MDISAAKARMGVDRGGGGDGDVLVVALRGVWSFEMVSFVASTTCGGGGRRD